MKEYNSQYSVLKAEKLFKRFGGLQAINGISFTLEGSKIYGLIGPNGAGKTTLTNLITGFLKPDQGSIWYRGQDITTLPPYRIARKGISRSFQDLRLFRQITALENVLVSFKDQYEDRIWRWIFGRRKMCFEEKERIERAFDLLNFVGLHGKGHTITDNLSYGEQKVLSIARLLGFGAEVLILDEPTSGVDPVSLKQIISIIKKLPDQKMTIILIEHNMDPIKELAEEVLFLDQGTIIAQGTPEEIITNPELGRIYFGR